MTDRVTRDTVLVSPFVRDLILRVMLKIVRLSLKDRPPPNAKRSYTEYKIQVRDSIRARGANVAWLMRNSG